MVSYRIVDFRFFDKFHRFWLAKIFSFSTIMEHVNYPSKKFLIKENTSSRWWVLLWKDYGWFLIELFLKFHRSGPAKIFNFWTITEHVSYPSKKLLIKQKTSSRWWLFFLEDYGWFLMKLSILYFSSNFTSQDLQWFSVFELSWIMLVIHQKNS